jgi:hypothetical protein
MYSVSSFRPPFLSQVQAITPMIAVQIPLRASKWEFFSEIFRGKYNLHKQLLSSAKI